MILFSFEHLKLWLRRFISSGTTLKEGFFFLQVTFSKSNSYPFGFLSWLLSKQDLKRPRMIFLTLFHVVVNKA